MIDVSYENGCLVIGICNDKSIEGAGIYYHSPFSQRGTKLAKYSSKSKALRALEMFRWVYIGYVVEKVYHEGNCDCMPIFQFPKDEDVDVEDE